MPFLRKNIVAAAKHVGADLLEYAAPELQRLLLVQRISRQLKNLWEDTLWENI